MKKIFGRIYWRSSNRQLEGVVIPQTDLDRLEKARLELWNLICEEEPIKQTWWGNITQTMWFLTHRKYPPAV
jgi:hypothetical protein